MKKRRLALYVALCIAATALITSVAYGTTNGKTGAAGTAGGGLGSSYDVSKAGKAKLTVWWLGDQEIPGIEGWMKETIAKYEKLHPNITINTVLQSTDTYTTTQKTACKGGSGPDIWYNWGGSWALEQTWAGCTVPNEEALSPADLQHVPTINGTRWGGHTWVYPLYRYEYPIVYNKTLFKKAGLDPARPPLTWTQFIADAKKLKAAGITPLVVGLKDGFGGENLAVALQTQLFSVPDLIQMVVSGDFSSGRWKAWLQKAVELKPYFNNDTNSIPYAQGLARFQAGKAAMVFASPGYQQTIIAMDKAHKSVGVMKVPVFGDTGSAGILYQDTPGFQVTRFAKDKALAGNFLAFMHTQDRMRAMYAETGDFPNDSNWDTAQIKRPTDKLIAKWIKEKTFYYGADYYPTDLDVNGNFVAFQGILGGNMTAAKAASIYESVITKWRKLQSGEVANYKTWLKGYGK